MHQWGTLDLDAVICWLGRQIKPAHIWLIGHSAGGQLIGLAEHSQLLSGIVIVAGQSAYWWNFTSTMRWVAFGLWYVALPLSSVGRDYLPARHLGLASVDLPSGVAREWAPGTKPGISVQSGRLWTG